ncbi:MBL fold metallo-hydrolase [Streptomyces bikiniensis]|uniref:MBL fold metallo-hydrolase n=1 Tax=Streptomyces bikiniensis TaxID=1896 RepID=A0ABW8CWH7_STRBI
MNAFLLRSGQPVLVDTGMPVDREGFLDSLRSLLDPAGLRWIAVTHDDRDHTGALTRVLEAAPYAKVLANVTAVTRMSEEFGIPRERLVTANPGNRVRTGDRELSFHRPPTFDSPGTLAVLDHSDGTPYSSDSFGTVVEGTAQDFADLDEEEFFPGSRC